MPNNTNILVVVSLKCFSNFRRSLNLPLINCEIELDLKWEHYWVILEISRTFTAVDPNVNLVEHKFLTSATSATFEINKAKLYVPVFTFFINDNIKFLENIKRRFKRKMWNNYRPERTTQQDNLDDLIDPTFLNINRLFVLSFKNGNNDLTRDSFDQYYMLKLKIKDFNALIDNKPFFDQPVKHKRMKN